MSTHSCNELCARSETLHWVQKRFKDDWNNDEAKALADMIPRIKAEIAELQEALRLLEEE